MLSGSAIRSISNTAAYRAAQAERTPLYVWGQADLHHLPFLGSYVPAGWREVPDLEVLADSTGLGSPSEPALTFSQLERYVREHPGYGWAILEAGEFQVVIGAFKEDPEAEGTPAPEPEPCEYCGTIHNDLEQCEPCQRCGHDPFDHGIDAADACEDCDCEGVVKVA